MKQQINLYLKQEKIRTPLSALTCLLAVLAVAVVLIVVSIWQTSGLNGLRLETAELKQQKAELESETAQLREQKKPRVESPELRRTHDRLQQKLADQRLFAGLLSELAPSGSGVFSPLLDALSDKAVNGVWLERIQTRSNGRQIDLQGHALNAELVPKYLDRLGEAEVYQNSRIDQFELSEDEQGMRFSISGTLAVQEGG